MVEKNYCIALATNKRAIEVYEAINKVQNWWTENVEGATQNVADEFKVTFGTTWKRFKITELIPGKKVEWLVTDCFMPWNSRQTEWTGTKVSFEIGNKGKQTVVQFTHHGLVPAFECYEACTNAWGDYIHNSLLSLINKGLGKPDPLEKKKKVGKK